MNSKVVLGQYYNVDSWIHRLDPRTKILILVLFMVGVFLINDLTVLLGVLGFIIALIISSKIPFTKFLKSIQMMSFILLFTFFCQILFRKTGNLLITFDFQLNIINLAISIVLLVLYFLSKKIIKKFRITLFLVVLVLSFVLQTFLKEGYVLANYSIEIYDDSLSFASFIIVRITLLLFASSLLTFTTKPTELNNGLEKLLKPLKVFKVNVSILSMMISIALRNIPTLINEANKILKAQASRGVDFEESNLKEKIMQIISLIVPMFIIAYRKAEDLSDAMEARGYDPNKPRTSINLLKFKTSDYVSLVLSLLAISSLIVLKIVL